jgi:hypothetical protein
MKKQLERELFEIDDTVTVCNIEPLEGNTIAPELTMGEERKVIDIAIDSKGNQHLNVGIPSQINYVRSYETGEELPNGDKIHWCHPSRFKKKL